MRAYQLYLSIFFLVFSSVVPAQVNKAKFQKDFFAASPRTKVRLVGSIPFNELREVYPFIKDTLDRIKKDTYSQSTEKNKDLKFLFDKIEADEEMFNQNYGRAIFILESALHNTANNINDTLICFSMLKSIFIKIKNVNRAFEMQYILENKWHRKSDTVDIDFGLNKSYLFHMLGLNEEAVIERRKEFEQSANRKDTITTVNYFNDMGVYFNKQKKSDSAGFYFLRARDLLAKKHVESGREVYYAFYKGLIDGNLGQSFYNEGKIMEALPLLKRDAYYSLKSDNYESAFNSYNLIISCYIDLKDKKNAKAYIDSCQSLLNIKLYNANLRIKFLPTLAKYYTLVNDYKNATESYRDYERMNDSLLRIEKEKDIINQGLTFNIEQREQAYAEQENKVRRGEAEEARQKIIQSLINYWFTYSFSHYFLFNSKQPSCPKKRNSIVAQERTNPGSEQAN